MSPQVIPQPTHTLTLTAEERDSLLRVLRKMLGDARIEVHRTHTPAFREGVLGEEVLIRNLIGKLEHVSVRQGGVSPSSLTGIEEGPPVHDDLYIDEQGRFQMPAEDLEDFMEFLRDNKVHAEIEPEVVVHSGGHTYGYGRLVHLFDAESACRLYRMWQRAQESCMAACAAV
jgi:hypothetical protein